MKKEIKNTFWTCDVCKKEIKEGAEVLTVKYPVIFLTEQTEGRTCRPYISYESLDLCVSCSTKVLVVTGVGAQGYNEYASASPTLMKKCINAMELKKVE